MHDDAELFYITCIRCNFDATKGIIESFNVPQCSRAASCKNLRCVSEIELGQKSNHPPKKNKDPRYKYLREKPLEIVIKNHLRK